METEEMLEAFTESKAKKFRLKWTIEDFSFACPKTGANYTSPDFQFKFNENCVKSRITLWADAAEIFAKFHFTELKDSVLMKYEFILFNSRFEKLAVIVESTPASHRQGHNMAAANRTLIKWKDLVKGISYDDKLILICDVIISNSDYKPIIMSEPSASKLQCCIASDFGKLRMDVDYSDMTISVCGKEFRVHKNILAARSSVFASMFKHGMKEAKSGQVEIDDIEPEVLDQFLDFIYTGKAKIDEYAWELFPAAEKYDVQDLTAICEDFLANNITKENCLKTLVLGDLHSAEKLKKIAMNFIVANAVEIDENELAQLEDKSLILELLKVTMRRK